MYHAPSRLPHLLRPVAYLDPAQLAREQKELFRGAWHFLGTLQDLPRPGMFFTRIIRGMPLIVRNFGGEISVLSNICAHRHCLLTGEKRGTMETLRCRYHGWEYQADGQTGKIPGAQNFKPLSGQRPAIRRFRSELCGALIFAALDDDAPPLADFLGDLHGFCQERFGPDNAQFLAMETDFPVNWKVPVENTLESYHIPMIHPKSFSVDPGDEGSEHVLRAGWTGFRAGMFSSRLRDVLHKATEALVQSRLFQGREPPRRPTGIYRHIHIFPNLLLAVTDTLALAQSFEPTSPISCTGIARQFGLYPCTAPFWSRPVLGIWNRIQAHVTRTILIEDMPAYTDIQTGLAHSRQPGMLGRCEERIYQFQKWIVARAPGTPHQDGDTPDIALDSDGAMRVFMGQDCPAGEASPDTPQPDRAAAAEA